jgi:hypothetical protein
MSIAGVGGATTGFGVITFCGAGFGAVGEAVTGPGAFAAGLLATGASIPAPPHESIEPAQATMRLQVFGLGLNMNLFVLRPSMVFSILVNVIFRTVLHKQRLLSSCYFKICNKLL